jgi:hypothetical protein
MLTPVFSRRRWIAGALAGVTAGAALPIFGQPQDGHADLLVQGDEAYIFYFTHPQRIPGVPVPASPAQGIEPYATRRTSIQVARLDTTGERLICDRNAVFPFHLKPGIDNWSR